ncbi:MAG: RHS repeat-associated core domain-containing protein, partial [Steroidobacter sp.]
MLCARCRLAVESALTFIAILIIATLDAHAAVERTQGGAAVSPRGTSQYAIPFTVPPGVNGMTPALALTYSQEIDNGIIGIGWSIAGLSEISRCSKTIPFDGGVWPTTLVPSDAYCLDGNRLRLTSGGYGAVNSTYQTVVDTYARATITGANANGPTSWEIRKKDGLIYEYGNTLDSRVEVVGTAAVRTWALNKIKDRSGNWIEFVYEEDTTFGAYRPFEIRYGRHENASTPHTTKVVFVYETATRPDPIYAANSGGVGGPAYEFKRLDRMDVVDIASSTTVRTYDLTYEAAGGAGNRSRLSTVQESRGSDVLLPTTIQWTTGAPGWASTETSTGVAVPAGFHHGDINGDNRVDIVFSSSTTSGGGTWRYMLGTESGFGPAANTTWSNVNFASAQLMEWNGDGMIDVLVPCSGGGTWCVMVATGSGFLAPSNIGVPAIGEHLAVDVNCDGIDDLVRVDNSRLPNRVFTRIRAGSGFAAETLAWTAGYNFFLLDDFGPTHEARKRGGRRKLDLNADGCADFLADTRDADPEPGTANLYSLTWFLGTSSGLIVNESVGGEQNHPISIVAAGDFNGDGRTDLLRSNTASSVGWGGVQGPPMTGFDGGTLFVGDYDGDGLDDIGIASASTGAWYVSRSTGNAFGVYTSMGFSGGVATYPIDSNGDGGVDLVGAAPWLGSVLTVRLRNSAYPDFVDRITDGFGMYIDFDYVRLTNAGGAYVKGTGAVLPTIDYLGPMYVVARMTSTTGAGSTYHMTYAYEGGRLHLQGHGFLGFAKRTQTDSRNDVITEDTYLQDATRWEVLGAPSGTVVKQSDGTPMSETSLTWGVLTAGSGSTERRFPYVASQTVKQYEVSGDYNGRLIRTSTTTTDGVDAVSGLIYDSKTTVLEASSANGLQPGSSYEQRTYHPLGRLDNDTTGWCLGRPGQTQHVSSHAQPGGGALTRTTDRVWDLANCRVTQEILEPGNATRQVTKDVGYDTFGNLNSMTVIGRNPDGTAMTPRESTANWGANGRFLRWITNPLLQRTSFGWDEAIAVRTSVTDPNQLMTSWLHDSFGRVTRETRPDSTATTFTYNDCASDGCLDANNKLLIKQAELDTGGAVFNETWIYLDRLNRPLASRSTLVSGASTRVERRYDAFGRLAQESAPCSWASCVYFWTEYEYDAAHRVTQISRPTSEINQTEISANVYYEGLATRRVDLEGKQSTAITNVLGAPLRIADHDGYYVQFQRDAHGNPLQTSDSASVILEAGAFDGVGFQTLSTIRGAGTRTSAYNSLGEVASQTDAKTQTTTFGYDALGRPTSRVDAQGTTTFNWGANAAAKNIGRLESKWGPTGVGEIFTYDPFGRPLQTTINLGADGSYAFDYSYNALGALDTLTYPLSTSTPRLQLKYEYANGHLARITDFNPPTTVFWAANSVDLRGQVTQETLGNGLVTTRSFDAVTGDLRSIRTGVGGGNAIQNLSFLWDAMGNLIQRQDGNQGLTENFYYDNLYRLDYSQLNGVTNLDVGYDARGSITSKQDASDSAAEGGNASWFANDLGDTLNATLPQGSGSSRFLYDADGARYRQVATQGSTSETTLYIGGLVERVTSGAAATFRHYIDTPTGPVGVDLRSASGANTMYYTLRDHLGSVDKITNASAGVAVALSYSAYGLRRGSNWTGAPSASNWTAINSITHRGFTGHEHLDNIGLIHMNGRIYQPSLGRFLSSDPVFDANLGIQGFNRYAYVGNRAVSLIDPSGF